MTKKIKVLFFLYKSKINKRGEAPIYCRLTLNTKRRHFSTGYFIPLDGWNALTHTVNSTCSFEKQINDRLSAIQRSIYDITLKYELNKYEYTLGEVWNEVNGEKRKNVKGFLQVFDKHNEEVESLVGRSYTNATYKKFLGFRNQVASFIKEELNQDDVLLSNLKLKFILNFETFLLVKRNMKQISVNKTIQRTRKIIKYAIAHELLEKDPFALYKPKSVNIDVVYLSPEELYALEKYQFVVERLDRVRDCFVFCCYTGLPYREMADLREHHISKGFDGKDWITIQRKKTNKPLKIPVLPQAAIIIDKYKGEVKKDNALLPVITNQRFNQYLKEIAKLIGLKKKLTHHMARKTFASSVLLFNDVPMEIVSELLGHSNVKITQKHYAKVSNKKVSSQIERLVKKLDNKGYVQ